MRHEFWCRTGRRLETHYQHIMLARLQVPTPEAVISEITIAALAARRTIRKRLPLGVRSESVTTDLTNLPSGTGGAFDHSGAVLSIYR